MFYLNVLHARFNNRIFLNGYYNLKGDKDNGSKKIVSLQKCFGHLTPVTNCQSLGVRHKMFGCTAYVF